MAIRAPWPVAEEEDKILTRQARFLRESIKHFRSQAGRAKKGWMRASILVNDSYPQWKIDTLVWMQGQYDVSSGFSPGFMKDLKDYTAKFVTDKKLIKFTMQFASFMKKETEDVGDAALDVLLPFDQKEILQVSIEYIKAQLNIEELDIIQLGVEEAPEVPERVRENVTPGKPSLYIR